MARHADGTVNSFEDVGFEDVALPQELDARAVAVEDLAVLGELGELDLGHVHESVDFVFGAFEILDTEGVDGDDFAAGFVADFEDLGGGRSAADPFR